ncbi:uncharacterized protein LOC135940970 [Cloeon dipterum]|uniref:uncharacterized protein LOC135940970 n=1 Tax=Cloeon dipterum TaxID=197152 RepID=UPI00321F9506
MNSAVFAVVLLFLAFIHPLDCGKKRARRFGLGGLVNRQIIKIKTYSHRSEPRSFIIKCCGRRKCSKLNKNKIKNGTSKTDGWRSAVNGPSFKPVRIGTKKYMFPYGKANYEGAKKICEKENMEIASFDSPDEVSKISEYLQYIGLSDDPVLSSISAVVGGGAFSNWGSGSPPGGPGDCLVQQDGKFYNASCSAKSNFVCEDPKEVDKSSLGLDSLSSIEDAVLNFVGGKNLVVPSERASVPEAKSMCKDQGLELMSLDSLTQLDSVQDFLGDIGLSSSTLLTSMSKVTDGGSDWLGDLASALLPPKDPSTDGDCLGLSTLGLTGVSCDMVSNFVCQAPDPPGFKPSPQPKPTIVKTTKAALLTKNDLTSSGSDTEATGLPTKEDATVQAEEETTESKASLESSSGFDSTYGIQPETTQSDAPTTTTTQTTTQVIVTTSTTPTTTTRSTTSVATTVAGTTTTTSPTTTLTTTATTTTTTLPPVTVTNYTTGSRITILMNETATYEEAVKKCKELNMKLLTLDCSGELRDFILKTSNITEWYNASYFLDLKFINGSYVPWTTVANAKTYIRNTSAFGECVTVKQGSLWFTPCDQKAYFICETIPLAHTSVNYSVSGRYFVPLPTRMCIDEANSYCNSIDESATLLYLDIPFELDGEAFDLITSLNLANERSYVKSTPHSKDWILLNNKSQLGWADNHPNVSAYGSCIATLKGKLLSEFCNYQLPFVCETTKKNLTDHYILRASGRDYLISGYPVSNTIAEAWCQSYGRAFLIIQTSNKFQEIADSLSHISGSLSKGSEYLGIGLRFIDRAWKWSNGSLKFENAQVGWYYNTPSSSSTDCAGFLSQGNAVKAFDCSTRSRIICE